MPPASLCHQGGGDGGPAYGLSLIMQAVVRRNLAPRRVGQRFDADHVVGKVAGRQVLELDPFCLRPLLRCEPQLAGQGRAVRSQNSLASRCVDKLRM